MKITDQHVTDIARLANLELSEAERARMVGDLTSILEYIELLNQADTSDIEPHKVSVPQVDADSATRDDLPGLSLSPEDALKNAPASSSNFFKVPKVIEK